MAGSAAWHKGARSHFGASKVYIDAHRILAVVSTLRLAGWNRVLEDASKLKTSLICKVKSVKFCCLLLLCGNVALGLNKRWKSQSLLKWKMENLIESTVIFVLPASDANRTCTARDILLCAAERESNGCFFLAAGHADIDLDRDDADLVDWSSSSSWFTKVVSWFLFQLSKPSHRPVIVASAPCTFKTVRWDASNRPRIVTTSAVCFLLNGILWRDHD